MWVPIFCFWFFRWEGHFTPHWEGRRHVLVDGANGGNTWGMDCDILVPRILWSCKAGSGMQIIGPIMIKRTSIWHDQLPLSGCLRPNFCVHCVPWLLSCYSKESKQDLAVNQLKTQSAQRHSAATLQWWESIATIMVADKQSHEKAFEGW